MILMTLDLIEPAMRLMKEKLMIVQMTLIFMQTKEQKRALCMML